MPRNTRAKHHSPHEPENKAAGSPPEPSRVNRLIHMLSARMRIRRTQAGQRRVPNRKRLFLRVLLTYLALVCAVTLPYIPLYRLAYQNARDAVVNESFSTMQAGFRDINEKINTIYKNAYAVQTDPYVQKLKRLPATLKSSDYHTLQNAQNMLRNVTLTSDLLFASLLVFRDKPIVLTNSQSFTDSENMFAHYNHVASMTYDQWRAFLLDNPDRMALKPSVTVEIRGSIYDKPITKQIIHCVVSLPLDNLVYRDSAFVGMLDVENIMAVLASKEVREEGFLVMSDKNGTQLFAHRWTGAAIETNHRIEEQVLDGVPTTLMTVSDPKSRIRLVAGLPSSVFARRIAPTTGILLFFLIGAALAGLAIAVFFANRQARPIQSIVDAIGGLFRDGGTDPADPYAFIREAFTDLNDSNRQYQRQINQLNESVRIAMTYRLLQGDMMELQQKDAYLREHAFQDTFFCVAFMATHDHPEALEEGDKMASVVLAEWLASHVEFRYVLHNLEPGKSVILFNLDSAETSRLDEIEAHLLDISKFLRTHSGIETRFGLSAIESGMDRVTKCYIQAKGALRFGDLVSGSTVLRCGREYNATAGAVFAPAMALRLGELIVMGETARVEKVFLEIAERIAQAGPLDETSINETFLSIQNTLRHAASQIGKELPVPSIASPNAGVLPLRSLIDRQCEVACQLCAQAISRQHSRNAKLRESILAFLEAQYTDPGICVSLVAEKFNLSEKYLFSFVKEQTGKSFGDYIESLRLQRAEALLRDTEDAINVIHEKIGFNSQNTFYKVFKRVYGVSPGTWRTHHKQDGSSSEP